MSISSRTQFSPDPFETLQWHLHAPAGARFDLNLSPLGDAFTGRGVRVGVLDDGFHLGHRDLAGVFDLAGPWDHREGDRDVSAGAGDHHGTLVAGLIAARRNGYGTTGVAPEAVIEPHRLQFGSTALAGFERALLAQRFVDVSNNSWGFTAPFQDNFGSTAFAGLGGALARGAVEGRGGLGTVFVFAVGAGWATGDDVNAHNLQNSRFAIAVAGVDRDGRPLTGSSPGAAILAAAPGRDILTTDAPGGPGRSAGDHAIVSGNSFAAAQVSGVVARMLDANPDLGFRDVQIILAATARPSLVVDGGGKANAGGWLNGGGPVFSHRAGFGVVDAAAAVRLAEAWSGVRDADNEIEASATLAAPARIPSMGATALTLRITEDVWVERMALDLRLDHGRIGELRVSLVSPGGTTSVLLDRPGARPTDPGDGGTTRTKLDFRLTTVAPLGESAEGDWLLHVEDLGSRGTGQVTAATLTAYGSHASDPGQAFQVITDQFAHASAGAAATLSGRPGRDALLGAALSGDAVIDIRPGETSTIAGRSVKTATGDLIDDVAGGAGHDRLFGNWIANRLDGRAGDDLIDGRLGDDVLIGGAGNDTLLGGEGNDTLLGGTGDDVIKGGAGDDVIEGGAGDDRLSGGAGADVFVYRDGDFGRDVVTDFVLGVDRFDFRPAGLDRASLTVSQVGGAVVLGFGAASITVEGATAAQFASDLPFV